MKQSYKKFKTLNYNNFRQDYKTDDKLLENL